MASAALVGVEVRRRSEVAADAVPLTSSAKVFMVVAAAVAVGADVVAAEEVADEGGEAEAVALR